MEKLSKRIKQDVRDIHTFLMHWDLYTFTQDEKQELVARSQKVLDRLESLSDQALTAGLLGGTGVGKSTLMNSLAGDDIASTSHRRPHTNRVLLYRYEAAVLPAFLEQALVPMVEIVHQAEAINQIILCDLPDFDSLIGDHSAQVQRFLEHLDVLIMVTSPEKYADHLFYEFLKQLPKAFTNLYFVLNKADQVFEGKQNEQAYQDLATLTALFQEYLKKTGITAPLIYVLSAREAFLGEAMSPWNQFPAFSREIFRRREAKEVMAIKAANLDTETRQLSARLQAEAMHLETLKGLLGGFIDRIKKQREERNQAGKEILDSWIRNRMRIELTEHLENLNRLIGPGYLVAKTVHEWRRVTAPKRETPGADPSQCPYYDPPKSLYDQWQRYEDRLVYQVLQQGLPASLKERIQASLNFKGVWEDFRGLWHQQVDTHFSSRKAPAFLGFRLKQYLIYFILSLLFILALIGEEAGRHFFNQPGWLALLHVGFSFLQRLFSSTGLGALLSFGIVNLLLGVGFHRRYQAYITQKAEKYMDILNQELAGIWSEELVRLEERLSAFGQEVSDHIDRIKQ